MLTKISSENCCSRDHQLTYARSANPKNCSKSTRPFSSLEWVGSGTETTAHWWAILVLGRASLHTGELFLYWGGHHCTLVSYSCIGEGITAHWWAILVLGRAPLHTGELFLYWGGHHCTLVSYSCIGEGITAHWWAILVLGRASLHTGHHWFLVEMGGGGGCTLHQRFSGHAGALQHRDRLAIIGSINQHHSLHQIGKPTFWCTMMWR